ncbi:MAG: hydrogenase maturation protease [Spirochaetes bacterium]|nr:hydrogenase maturation protease [Spirochaetota bacterium]
MPALGVAKCLAEGACVVGVGNYLRHDDAAGPYIADTLVNKAPGLAVLNVEDVLENYVFRIAERTEPNVIIVDAVTTGGVPGSVVFGPMASFIEHAGATTHKAALSLSSSIFEKSGKKVWLFGIEAKDTGFGAGISPEVRQSADAAVALFMRHAPSTASVEEIVQ